MTLDRQATLEGFREALLSALDAAALRAFAKAPMCGQHDPGATDADLPSLFAVLDRHVDRLAERYGVEWDGSQP